MDDFIQDQFKAGFKVTSKHQNRRLQTLQCSAGFRCKFKAKFKDNLLLEPESILDHNCRKKVVNEKNNIKTFDALEERNNNKYQGTVTNQQNLCPINKNFKFFFTQNGQIYQENHQQNQIEQFLKSECSLDNLRKHSISKSSFDEVPQIDDFYNNCLEDRIDKLRYSSKEENIVCQNQLSPYNFEKQYSQEKKYEQELQFYCNDFQTNQITAQAIDKQNLSLRNSNSNLFESVSNFSSNSSSNLYVGNQEYQYKEFTELQKQLQEAKQKENVLKQKLQEKEAEIKQSELQWFSLFKQILFKANNQNHSQINSSQTQQIQKDLSNEQENQKNDKIKCLVKIHHQFSGISCEEWKSIPKTFCNAYNEISTQGFSDILNSLKTTQCLYYQLNEYSSFLDLSSGLGRCAFQTALLIGCRVSGIEKDETKAYGSQLIKDLYEKNFGKEESFQLVQIMNKDALQLPLSSFNPHTHIFCQNQKFENQQLHELISILNQSDFKVLVWCQSPSDCSNLKNVVHVQTISSRNVGGDEKMFYVYHKFKNIFHTSIPMDKTVNYLKSAEELDQHKQLICAQQLNKYTEISNQVRNQIYDQSKTKTATESFELQNNYHIQTHIFKSKQNKNQFQQLQEIKVQGKRVKSRILGKRNHKNQLSNSFCFIRKSSLIK